MLERLLIACAASVLVACSNGAPPTAQSWDAGEPDAPSIAVARFTRQDAGHPDAGAAHIEVHEIGKISLPDAQLAVSDAFINDVPLVIANLAAGDFPVEILVAATASDRRVAAARIRLRQEPIATWRRVGGFAVDSGTAAFFDPRLSAQLNRMNVTRFNRHILDELKQSTVPTYSTMSTTWEGMTYVAFSTGFGDGGYPVYVGASASGEPVTVLIDCDILPWTNSP